MYYAAFVFLVIAGIIALALAWISIGRQVHSAAHAQVGGEHTGLSEHAAWDEIRAVWTEWYSPQQSNTSAERSLFSWGRTLAFCAALCLIGILLEIEFNSSISIDHIVSGFMQSTSITYDSRPHAPRSTQAPSKRAANRSQTRVKIAPSVRLHSTDRSQDCSPPLLHASAEG